MLLLYISLIVLSLLLIIALVFRFASNNNIEIKYGNKPIAPNAFETVEETKHQPDISIPFSPYTLIMFDWDAPSSKLNNKQYLHWAITSEKTLVPYQPPSPPQGTGIHRYQFNTYKGLLDKIDTPRDQFDISTVDLKLESSTLFNIRS